MMVTMSRLHRDFQCRPSFTNVGLPNCNEGTRNVNCFIEVDDSVIHRMFKFGSSFFE